MSFDRRKVLRALKVFDFDIDREGASTRSSAAPLMACRSLFRVIDNWRAARCAAWQTMQA